LVDGFGHATWKVRKDKGTSRLEIKLLEPLSKHDEAAVAEEGKRLLEFVVPTDRHDIAFIAPAD
jgi:hypothetical protein